MSGTTNYNESDVLGTKWQRACRIIIDNPYNMTPSINFIEEEVVNLGDKVFSQIVSNLDCRFDSNNELHTSIYIKLNELYTLLREARDSA